MSDLMAYAVGGATRPDSFSGMDERFSTALSRMFADAPDDIRSGLKVSSGYRSKERQAKLWAEALQKHGSADKARKWVAPPGRSQHNHGNAADLKFLSPKAREWVHANAEKYGLAFPLSNEDWHIELAGARMNDTVERAPLADVASGDTGDSRSFMGGNTDLKERARKELLKRRAKAELERRKAKPAGHDVPEFKPVGVEGYNPETGLVEKTGAMDKIGAFLTSAIEGVPVAGPMLKKAATGAAAGIVSGLEGENFGDVYNDMSRNTADLERDNPGWATAGYVTGAIAPMVALGGTTLGGRALGVTGNSFGGRVAASTASNAIISGADTAARGGDAGDIAKSAAIGGGLGAAIPSVGRALNSIGGAIRDTVAPRLNAIVRPAYEAERRVGTAMSRDAANAPVLGAADEASAAANQQQLLNVDRGGETSRALARSAANTDPEARAIIERTASERFGSQGDRARSFIDRITGGRADDLAVQEKLRTAAQAMNKPAYKKAYSEGSDLVKTPELERLIGSPAVVEAMKGAIKNGKNRAVKEGLGAFNPAVSITDDGRVVFNRTNSAGGTTFPDLQFWDYTKRELDDMANAAARSGRNGEADTLRGLAAALRNELDTVVPSYKEARAGAAAFFDAEDALEAGKKFVMQNRQNAEVAAALKKMNPAERASFAVGFASEMKDAIAQTGDRTNVINKLFGSQQARDKIKLALGQKAFSEFEQFVKVENAMDMLRGAMGNSTTARQLAELGLAGGAGLGATAFTGDWKSGLGVGILTGLARRYGAKVDEKVTKRVAELLLSDDPKALKQAVTLASNSPKASAALEAIQAAISSALKGAGNVSTRPERQPLEITVTQPNGVEAAP